MNLDKLFSKCEVKIKTNSRDAQKVKSTRLVIKVADGKTGKWGVYHKSFLRSTFLNDKL